MIKLNLQRDLELQDLAIRGRERLVREDPKVTKLFYDAFPQIEKTKDAQITDEIESKINKTVITLISSDEVEKHQCALQKELGRQGMNALTNFITKEA